MSCSSSAAAPSRRSRDSSSSWLSSVARPTSRSSTASCSAALSASIRSSAAAARAATAPRRRARRLLLAARLLASRLAADDSASRARSSSADLLHLALLHLLHSSSSSDRAGRAPAARRALAPARRASSPGARATRRAATQLWTPTPPRRRRRLRAPSLAVRLDPSTALAFTVAAPARNSTVFGGTGVGASDVGVDAAARRTSRRGRQAQRRSRATRSARPCRVTVDDVRRARLALISRHIAARHLADTLDVHRSVIATVPGRSAPWTTPAAICGSSASASRSPCGHKFHASCALQHSLLAADGRRVLLAVLRVGRHGVRQHCRRAGPR